MTLYPSRLQWTVGWTAAGALGIIVILLSSAYRQGRIEQDIVADLLSKSPAGAADVDIQPVWYGRLYQTLGIRRPFTSLFLDGDQLKDDDLEKLNALRHLTLLSLDRCVITDEGVKHIAKVRTLESLTLFGCDNITDNGIVLLSTIPSLSALGITATQSDRISRRGIESLTAMAHLEILRLNGCTAISDDAVEPLSALTHLVNLDIRGTSITEEGANRLESGLPQTIILRD